MLARALRRWRNEESGQALVLTGLASLALIGMAALALDIGMLLEARRQTQNAADAAAHAAAQEMPDQAAAEAAAQLYWDLNAPTLGNATLEVSFPDSRSVRVEASNEIDFMLAPVLGIDSGDVTVAAEVGADALPADVVIAMDTSGSMCADSHGLRLTCPGGVTLHPWQEVEEATLAFPDYLLTHTEDWLGLVSFSTEPHREMPMSQGYASYPTHVGNLHPDGYTNIGGALEESIRTINQGRPNAGHSKIIVLVTDGIPNVYPGHGSNWNICGGSGCSQAYNYGRTQAEAAAAQGIRVYTIGLGDGVNSTYLAELASTGNGSYVESPTADDLEEAFAEVARRARIAFTE
ncbi:MAG: vWA domain-containing protein [Dehalococcoidia bacterium]